VKIAAAALVVLALAGCTAAPAPAPSPSASETLAFAPEMPTTGLIDYQLGGGYEPPEGTTIVARDRTDVPADGIFTICYVNGFQSQGEERDLWLVDNPELVLRDASGEPVVDENWPDEFLFDTSTQDKRVAIGEIVGEWVRGCANDGFDAVEFDNLDSFTRSNGALTEDDNVELAKFLVSQAHESFLLAGQKNSAELGARSPEIGFDFAVAEECQRWNECDLYTDVFGDYVIDIEYFDDLGGSLEEICADPDQPALTVFRDRDLTMPDNPAYRYESC
jgi:hypothetical protein